MAKLAPSTSWRVRVVAVLCLSGLVAAACGGSDDDEPAIDDPSADTTAPTDEEESASLDALGPLVAGGEPTPFASVEAAPIQLQIGDDGSCQATAMVTLDDQEPSFALCQVFAGAGGTFAVVTVSRDTDDHDTGLACEVEDDFVVVATAIGTGTPVSTTLDLAELGAFAVLTIHDDFVGDATTAESVIVAQPEGQDCPVVHGIGPTTTGAGQVRSHTAVIEVDSPGARLCTTYDGRGFATAPAPAGAGRCPEPG